MARAALEIDRISKRYGDLIALRELSLHVAEGELVGLVGGDGAGKTTTIRISAGVLAADSGTVRWRERTITERQRDAIGYLPAERGLYAQLRLVEQLVYLGELYGLDINDAHREAEHWLDRFGMRGFRSRRINTLPPADQQRAQLAIALMTNPRVLVFDEPFNDLDQVGVDVLANVLREKADSGAAVLFSSDTFDIAERICDRICVIHNGASVAVGGVAELRAGDLDTVVVDAPDAPPGWADNLPGTRVRTANGSRIVLEIDAEADDQVILATALSTGTVREFSRQPCSLTERFGELLGSGGRTW
ncbi:MAG TPA: ATP-binding cassette domain-containing protein [Pseudonocardiaceae bacterium]|nr:ATP-binding cassette domain-containing protein [Pseudonocardiaceae bacterium]